MEGETDMTNSEMLKEIKDGLNNVRGELTKGDDKEEKEEKAYKGAYKGEMKEMKEEKEMKEMKKGEEDALAYIETLEKFAHDVRRRPKCHS